MARYFGGFRDRLKKRSKHVPITIKDVEWVKVATTFSWSPAKRDYQWLEPEDYLSSFLNSSGASFDASTDLTDEIHGDGSMDAAMDMPFSNAAYDGSETLIGISSTDDELPPENTSDEESSIAYVPPYDFVPEPTPAYSDEGVLRPNIDVPAELPLLDEYKLEIVSALQRRGIKIEAEKIKLPEDLIGQLNAYHAGRVSIDSYDLRARLQKYKRQVIESYEQFNAVSGQINADLQTSPVEITPIEVIPGDGEKGSDETYEEFILSSLNRLEASMNDQEAEIDADMITPEPQGGESADVFDEASQTMDFRGAIRTTRHIETPPDTSDILAEALSEMDSKQPPEGDLPSSYADDSWLVLPVDSRKAGQDLENPDNFDDLAEQTLNVLNTGHVVGAPPAEETPATRIEEADSPEDPDPADITDSSELLKALNTINSRFPEATLDADTIELNTEDLAPALHDDLITPTPDSAATIPQDQHPASIEQPPETPAARSAAHELNMDRSSAAETPVPTSLEADTPISPGLEDETSLSDLLLQLRHEGDRTKRADAPLAQQPESTVTEPITPEPIAPEPIAPEPVTTESIRPEPIAPEPVVPEPSAPAPVEPEPITPEPVSQAPFTPAPVSPEPSVPTVKKQSPVEEESVEERRARYIEEERKKLYSIIDGLEETTAPVAETPASEPVEPPAPVVDTAPVVPPAPPAQQDRGSKLAERSKLIENILAAKENMAGGKPAAPNPVSASPVSVPPIASTPPAPIEPPTPVDIPPAAPAGKAGPPIEPKPAKDVPAPEVSAREVSPQELPSVSRSSSTPSPEQDASVKPQQAGTQAPIDVPPSAVSSLAATSPVERVPLAEIPSQSPVDESAKEEIAVDKPAHEVPAPARPFGAIGVEKGAEQPEVYDTSSIEDVFNNHEESLQNDAGAISQEADPVFSSSPGKTPSTSASNTPNEESRPTDVLENSGTEEVGANAIEDATRGIIADFAALDVREPASGAANLQSPVPAPATPVAPQPSTPVGGDEAHDGTPRSGNSEARETADVAEPIRPSKDKTYMSEPQVSEPTVPDPLQTANVSQEKPAVPEAAPAAVEPTAPEPIAASEAVSTPPAEEGIVKEVTVALETSTEEASSQVVPGSVKDDGLVEIEEPAAGDIQLTHVVESLAFATEDPIPLKKIARIFADTLGVKMPTEKKVRAAIATLNEAYAANGRTYRIKEWAGGVRMASHPQYAQFIRALYKDNRPKKLSRTLMETLAIIAYSQPSTKPEIDFVRGVDSDYAVRKLLELGLIDIVGRSDSIGRPLLYGTSERFLEQFGLSEIGALPKLREVEDLLGDPAFKKERLQLLALDEMDNAGTSAESANDDTGDTAEASAEAGEQLDASTEAPGDEPAT